MHFEISSILFGGISTFPPWCIFGFGGILKNQAEQKFKIHKDFEL